MKTAKQTIWIMGLYVICAAALLPLYQYHIAPDAISYVGIAQKYMDGQWAQAVNGYWGPLISWLLIPFMAAGLPPLMAGKVMLLLTGLLIIPVLDGLSGLYGLSLRTRRFILISSIPALLYFAILNFSPDLLLALVLLLYFNILFGRCYMESIWPAVLCGVLGALAYFCKQYGFMFFAAHFILFSILLIFAQQQSRYRKHLLFNTLLGVVVFAALSVVWISLISHKYGTFTLGTAGPYNQSLLSPEAVGHAYTRGLLPLPNATAVCAWEDPSLFPFVPWKPFAAVNDAVHYALLVVGNLIKLVEVLVMLSVFAPALLLAGFLLCMRSGRDILRGGREWYLLFALAVYAGGYMLVLVDLRFFSVACFLLLIMGGMVLDRFAEQLFFQSYGRHRMMVILLSLSFMAWPVMKLAGHYQTGRKYHVMAEKVSEICRTPARMASDSRWHDSFYISYLSQHAFLGMLNPASTCEEMREELHRMEVDYLLVWEEVSSTCNGLERRAELSVDGLPPLRIMQVK